VAASGRHRALGHAGHLPLTPEAVTRRRLPRGGSFFAAFDEVQVKYEMLRAHVVDGRTATATAAAHGYSRAAFYLVAGAFERSGMVGLLDERPGRRGRLKLSPEVIGFLVQHRRRKRQDAWGRSCRASSSGRSWSGSTGARSSGRSEGARERAFLADRRGGAGRLRAATRRGGRPTDVHDRPAQQRSDSGLRVEPRTVRVISSVSRGVAHLLGVLPGRSGGR
jgi:hypothetical protein